MTELFGSGSLPGGCPAGYHTGMDPTTTFQQTVLARYGAIPEVARCLATAAEQAQRGAHIVLLTDRGREVATVLEAVKEQSRTADSNSGGWEVEGLAQPADLEKAAQLAARARAEFPQWEERIAQWNLDLQLIDLEWTLDEAKLILYVLNERGPDCTRLAVQAAAAGLGVIEVQPVSAEGRVLEPTSGKGGCGSGGGCGCSH